MSWSDDAELVATFRAEVDDRLAALRDGLLGLESDPSPRLRVDALMRHAHTVKGSGRMLGLPSVVAVAHRCEDLLGLVLQGRTAVTPELVSLLLVSGDALGRALPGAAPSLDDVDLEAITSALDGAIRGERPIVVPRLPEASSSRRPDGDDDASTLGIGASVRVPTRRVHALLDVVGEAELEIRRIERRTHDAAALVAEQQAAVRGLREALLRGADSGELADAATAMVGLADRLQAATRDLKAQGEDALARVARVRDDAMGLAMVPLRRVVAAFPSLVRDIAGATGKEVALVCEGVDVELDVRVLDAVADALRHLVTNAVDHGCETPDERRAMGKPRRATVTVRARQAGATVVVEVADDGAGVDDEALRVAAVERGLDGTGAALHQLMFAPGLSTRADVTETSGRGVGLDVVRTAVEDLGGTVEVVSRPGAGTTFVLTLPVTLGVVRCLVVRCGDERYAVPLPGVVETLSLGEVDVVEVAGRSAVVRHDETVPLSSLADAVGAGGPRSGRVAVVVRFTGESLAWSVESVEGEREVVVKPLGAFLGDVPGTSGATIDDDGSVLLLLDLRSLAGRALRAPVLVGALASSDGGSAREAFIGTTEGRPRVLVVEDSIGVRELQRSILEAAGYDVVTAVDGLDGAARLQGGLVDLVLSDVEMPGMDGFTLTRTIRRTRGWENVPVVIMTSRGDDADRRAGLDAGADAYLLKSEFDQHVLVDTVRRLVGR
jgi:chemotaxis protein histidine kinase CheA